MVERKLLAINYDAKNIFHEIAMQLYPYCDYEKHSVVFVVEGTLEYPIVVIKYPGDKKRKRAGKIKYANLYDFLVIPYEDGVELEKKDFTYKKMFRDYTKNKINNNRFWELIEKLYFEISINEKPPELPGINSELYLLVLKWLWIQEDFNYKEVLSPIKYVLETKGGSRTKGAGRRKFFAALFLAKKHTKYFTYDEIEKITEI